MTTNVWFHVGYPKAASTLIQGEILAKARDVDSALRREGFHYLFHIRDPQEHHREFPVFARHEIFDEDARKAELGRLQDHAASSDRTVVVSNETMVMGGRSGNARYCEDPDTIVGRIQKWFPEAGILVVIRRQPDWFQSWYRDLIHSGRNESRTAEQMLESALWTDHVARQLRYDEKLAAYRDRFGEERVRVVPFEKIREDPTRFVESVCEALEIGVPNWENRHHNRGLSDPMIRARRRGNHLYRLLRPFHDETDRDRWDHLWFSLWKRHINKLQDITGLTERGGLLPDPVVDEIGNTFRESNRRLNEMINVDLERYEYDI